MSMRLPYYKLSAAVVKGFHTAGDALKESPLGKQMVDLVYLRVSQINGCAYCVDLHWKDLIAMGEDPRRLNSLPAWHETTRFSERERAALAWAESLTDISNTHAPDDVFEALKPHFSEVEISDLTFAVAHMNAWNRVAVGMRQPQPA